MLKYYGLKGLKSYIFSKIRVKEITREIGVNSFIGGRLTVWLHSSCKNEIRAQTKSLSQRGWPRPASLDARRQFTFRGTAAGFPETSVASFGGSRGAVYEEKSKVKNNYF